MTEMPFDVLNQRLGKIRDNGDIDFDNTALAVDIDSELQDKFIFFPYRELSEIAEGVEENRGRLYLGQGDRMVGCDETASSTEVYTLAENALALYWYVKRIEEFKQEKLARRPEPGLYQGRGGGGYFTVVVTEDRRLLVHQEHSGGLMDMTDAWDAASDSAADGWNLQRINITEGTVEA